MIQQKKIGIANDLIMLFDNKSDIIPFVPVLIKSDIKYVNNVLQAVKRIIEDADKIRTFATRTIMTTKRYVFISTVLPLRRLFDIRVDDNIHIYLNHRRGIPELPLDLDHLLLHTVSELGTTVDNIRKLVGKILSGSDDKQDVYITTEEVIKLLNIDRLHGQGITGSGVSVGIVDTGATPLLFNRHPQAGTGIKYIGSYADTNGHGTHVFTIALGRPIEIKRLQNKGVRLSGVAYDSSKKIVTKALSTPAGMGSDASVIEAIESAISAGAEIINLSLGIPTEINKDDDPLVKHIESYSDSNIIFVAAAGNEGFDRLSSPANASNAISIGAYNTFNDRLARFSNKGFTFMMPGVRIFSGIQYATVLDNAGGASPGYAILSGTSMATPFATGLLALIKQIYKAQGKDLTWRDVIQAGKERGEPWTPDRGYGLLTPDLFL